MFYPATSALAFFLVILAMFMWGSWPFIRSLCLANSPSFSQLYQIAQLSISLLACISLGNTQYNSNHLADFDNQVWAADVQHPGSSAKILCLLVGGIFNSQADFLCAAACV